MLNNGILELLNSSGLRSSEEIRLKISRALQIDPTDPVEVFVIRLTARQPASYIVAYNLLYCASCSKAWVGIIGKKHGHYGVLSDWGPIFVNKSLHLVSIDIQDRENYMVIYGTNWGDAHNRLTARGYTLGAEKLSEIRSRRHLAQGELKISNCQIILTFLTVRTPPWSERTEIYDVLPDRIQLHSSSQRPNP